MTFSIERVVAKYMQLREKKEAIERKAKDELSVVKSAMEQLEAFMLAKMSEDGVTSYKTRYGTAFRSTSDYAQVSSWDDVLEHIRNNDAWSMLEKRVNKMAIREHIELHSEPPPGVTYGQKVDINIRKPTAAE